MGLDTTEGRRVLNDRQGKAATQPWILLQGPEDKRNMSRLSQGKSRPKHNDSGCGRHKVSPKQSQSQVVRPKDQSLVQEPPSRCCELREQDGPMDDRRDGSCEGS